jgi:hypothetical protein
MNSPFYKSMTDEDLKAVAVAYQERIVGNKDKSEWVIVNGERGLNAPTFRFEAETLLRAALDELDRRALLAGRPWPHIPEVLLEEAVEEKKRRDARG